MFITKVGLKYTPFWLGKMSKIGMTTPDKVTTGIFLQMYKKARVSKSRGLFQEMVVRQRLKLMGSELINLKNYSSNSSMCLRM